MSTTTAPSGLRRPLSVLASIVMLAGGLAAVGAAPAVAADRTVALVGSLQSELGCGPSADSETGDWSPSCSKTELEPTDDEGVYAAEFEVPGGTYEYKVALDDTWDESYGLNGGGDNIPLTLGGTSTLRVVFDDTTKRVGLEVVSLAGEYTGTDDALVNEPVRQAGGGQQFYFVMTDRFANGDTSNDTGGFTGDRLSTGFDPTDKGFYNGGDIAGLSSQLDYIEGLGTTAIWLTPSFKNKPVQGSGDTASAGYHGYWITDFTQIDPHLGTNEELEDFIADAHDRGIKVFFDIITNHTADVISYAEGQYTYVSKEAEPYRDAAGNVFDPAEYADGDAGFPTLDPAVSFPYTPVVAETEDTVKVPDWLNDVRLYHNRGDSTYAGESSTYGDFSGLDDLMTENPAVVDGFANIYKSWVDFGIDGFRIDTAKHVNFEFWQQWTTDVLDYARSQGKDDFFMFGEVYEGDPAVLSPYVRDTDMNSVLDFAFQGGATSFAKGGSGEVLQNLFAGDDYYTTPDSSATALPTFLGNHDMGRIGFFLEGTSDPVARDQLAHALMFTSRGQPVVYYGDEQGFAGEGNGTDKEARQSLFASQVSQYQNELLVDGSPLGAVDRYGTDTTLYRSIADLSALRQAHTALVDGAQIERYATDGPGVYAFSRVDADERIEYLVALNNATSAQTVSIPTLTPGATFTGLWGLDGTVSAGGDGAASVTVPALSAVVLRADREVGSAAGANAVTLSLPTAGTGLTGTVPVSAELADDVWTQTSFAWRVAGGDEWNDLGTAEDTTPRVFANVSGLATGTLLEFRAVTTDAEGRHAAASTYASVGNAVTTDVPDEPDFPYDPEPQTPDAKITSASVPGSFNKAAGCTDDWQPACAQVQMTLVDGIYRLSIANLPGKDGGYQFKIATNGNWDYDFGAGGVPGGQNITLNHSADGPVTFYFDPRTKGIRTTDDGPIITLPGSYNSEVGCTAGTPEEPADWQPSCLATMMFDRDGDGVFQYSTDDLPTGAYQVKVAHGLSWDENYGRDGAPGGANIDFTATAGAITVFRYDLATHVLTVASQAPQVAGVGTSQAQWVDAGTIAVPAALGSGDEWLLYSSADAGLATGDGGVTGGDGDPSALTPIDGGLTDDQLARFPQLKGYAALAVDDQDRAAVAALLTTQLAVTRATGDRLTAFTGVQIPGVLDDLYADEVADADLGVTFRGNRPTFRLWAPTAQSATLLTWDPGADGEPLRHEAAWDAASGTWTVEGARALKGDEYLWEVVVYAPTTGAVETNQVTDPYSVTLTTNSVHSVAIDLDDREWQPRQWRRAEAPVIDQQVDRSIYELHIRDFSITDETVPEAERGTYLAFTRDSAGTQQLRQLAEAGIDTVHLLPSFDIASIEEDRALQQTPPCDLASFAPDSPEQQACIAQVANADGFNWGYDPLHWNAPEGSSSTDPEGGTRVVEFRSMVGALHGMGLQVVLDEVFNHTAASGQDPKSILDRVVPGYYQRLDPNGAVFTSTCCQNVATEHLVAQQLMVDSVVLWAKHYKVDGFRFDLMGHASKENMLAIRAALDELTLQRDGVDGSKVYLYGEGWNFGEVADDALFEQATQGQLGGTGIGTFSDRLRDAVHGGSPVDSGSTFSQGFGTGLGTDPNGDAINGTDAEALARLGTLEDLVRLGLAGNLRDFEFTTADGTVRCGDELLYNGQPAGYADQPDEVVTYVDAHDNETLFDLGVLKLPTDTSMADRVRMNTLSLATATLSQTSSFWHAGTELLRSKSLDRNSYNSGDWFNRIDWTGQESAFGSGLPPQADNGEKWPIMAPLLANPALKPTAADIAAAEGAALDLLRVRSEVPLLTLGSAELIEQKVTFPLSGPGATPGVIVMQIDDLVGDDVDPELDGSLVVFNASPSATTQTISGLAGRGFALTPALANGSDAVVKTTTWDAASGTVTVPARTVAVLTDAQVEPVDTRTTVSVSRFLVTSGSTVTVSGRVTADDRSAPVGTVTITDGATVVATVALTADANGRFSVPVTITGRGVHRIGASFGGGEAWNPSRTRWALPVIAY